MKCDKCTYLKMCKVLSKYQELINWVAELTDTKEPDYTIICNRVQKMFYFCHHYKEE